MAHVSPKSCPYNSYREGWARLAFEQEEEEEDAQALSCVTPGCPPLL